jgi:hypothetical protein
MEPVTAPTKVLRSRFAFDPGRNDDEVFFRQQRATVPRANHALRDALSETLSIAPRLT